MTKKHKWLFFGTLCIHVCLCASEDGRCNVQVSNWFANARRRLKRTVVGAQMSWAGRIRLYDSLVVGKQEPLDVSSDDDDDDDDVSDVTDGQIFARGQSVHRPLNK